MATRRKKEAEPRKRVVGLARISTDQDNQPYSLGAQRTQIEAFAVARDWTLVDIIEEEMSGAADVRPELEQLLNLVRSRKVDVVVVTRVDRLARTIVGVMAAVKEFGRYDVELVSVTEPIDTSSPTGMFFLQLLSIFAEFERNVFIERIRAGIANKASRGMWVGGSAPFGYKLVDGRLVINSTEAAVVKKVFRDYKCGDGANTIANALNDAGIKTARGNNWTSQGILGMLRRVTYRGLIKHLDETHQGIHKRIIDEKTFAQVASRLEKQRGPSGKRESRKYLLAGTLRCHLCGGAMTGALAGGNGGEYRYYRCSNANKARAKCSGATVRADELENEFINELVAAYRNTGFFEAALEAVRRDIPTVMNSVREELDATHGLIDEDSRRVDKYLDAFEKGRLDDSAVHERLQELLTSRQAKQARAAELEEQLAALETATAPRPDLSRAARIVEDVLRGEMEPTKRIFIEAAVASMTVDDQRRVALTLRVPSPGTLVSETSCLVELGGIEPPSAK
jgi:site-specific DNA recombinase